MMVILSACGGGGGESSPSAAPPTSTATATASTTTATARPVAHSDVEIAALLYADTQRTPAGFFKDSAPTFPGYVATLHLKNTDIAPAPNAPQYELCSDDWQTALNWSDQTASALSASTLVETVTTPRYHEFSRVRAGTPQGYIRTRVYRCSYLNRDTMDLRGATGVAGQLNQRPLTASELQHLSEYLWQFTAYNNYGHAVLKSSGASVATSLRHALLMASLGARTASGCDRINVFEWTHSVDSQTGALHRDLQPLWEFGARRSNGAVELCNPF